MPKSDEPYIDTADYGLAVSIMTPGFKNNPSKSRYFITFDSGVQMLVPSTMFETMRFNLQEKD